MTKEEREIALYCLKVSSDYHSEVCEECVKYPNCDHTIQDDVTETIIKALEQQPCEDCISRTELLAKIDEERKHLLDLKMDGAEHIVVHHARRIIEDMPSVTPSRPKGKWIDSNLPQEKYVCSECGGACWYYDYEGSVAKSKYCPNCGANMRGK